MSTGKLDNDSPNEASQPSQGSITSEQAIRQELQDINKEHLAYLKLLAQQDYGIAGVNIIDAMAYYFVQIMNSIYLTNRFGGQDVDD